MSITVNSFPFNKKLQILIVAICMLGLGSCDSGSVYEENVDIQNKTWLASDSVQFSFRIDEPDKKYDIFYNVRNTITYPYQNLYFTYSLRDLQGDSLRAGLMNIILFDPKTGKPHGNGLGDIFSHQYKILPEYQFPDTGVYTLHLKQAMRIDSLQEILSTGISVKEAVPASE